MARTVDEVMNRELFTVRPNEPRDLTRDTILALGITAAPVIDDERRPIAMVSLRELVVPAPEGRHVTSPVHTIRADAPLEDAGRLLVEAGVHQLVAVDETGRIAGVVSAMDVLRGLLGFPARHPPTFPHYDARTGLTWSDDTPLEAARVEAAPVDAGVVVIVHGGPGMRETPVWVEGAADMRGRLEHMLAWPDAQAPRLTRILRRTHLRFRTAPVADPARRAAIVAELEEGALPPPSSRVPGA